MSVPKRRATYDDLMQVPDHMVAELIDGELIVSPRPASPHAFATSCIGQDLGPFSREPGAPGGAPGGWWILFEPELHFADDVLVPDLAAWRHERMPRVPNTPAFTLAPDWACEVLSPSTSRVDRSRKMGIYGREGVVHLWLVDPLQQTVEIYRREGPHWVVVEVLEGRRLVRAEPFAAIEIDLGRWWIVDPPA
jgi:Uma2 family endonuclease